MQSRSPGKKLTENKHSPGHAWGLIGMGVLLIAIVIVAWIWVTSGKTRPLGLPRGPYFNCGLWLMPIFGLVFIGAGIRRFRMGVVDFEYHEHAAVRRSKKLGPKYVYYADVKGIAYGESHFDSGSSLEMTLGLASGERVVFEHHATKGDPEGVIETMREIVRPIVERLVDQMEKDIDAGKMVIWRKDIILSKSGAKNSKTGHAFTWEQIDHVEAFEDGVAIKSSATSKELLPMTQSSEFDYWPGYLVVKRRSAIKMAPGLFGEKGSSRRIAG